MSHDDRARKRARRWARASRAVEALRRWSSRLWGDIARVDVSGNATFRVRSSQGELFALRLYRPGRWTARAIAEEHEFMRYLGEDCGVLPPVPGCDRETLQVLEDGGYAALFPWVPGRSIRDVASAKQLSMAGEYLAEMHRRAVHFPDQGHRIRWDQRELLERSRSAIEREWSWYLPGTPPPLLGPRVAQIAGLWEGLDPGIGFLHGDYHWGNLKFHQGRILPLDFDDCGVGPLAWDLAVLLYLTEPAPDLACPLMPLLDGYNRRAPRPLRAREVWLFLWVRYLYIIRWIFERSELYSPQTLEDDVLHHLEGMERVEEALGWRSAPAA